MRVRKRSNEKGREDLYVVYNYHDNMFVIMVEEIVKVVVVLNKSSMYLMILLLWCLWYL